MTRLGFSVLARLGNLLVSALAGIFSASEGVDHHERIGEPFTALGWL